MSYVCVDQLVDESILKHYHEKLRLLFMAQNETRIFTEYADVSKIWYMLAMTGGFCADSAIVMLANIAANRSKKASQSASVAPSSYTLTYSPWELFASVHKSTHQHRKGGLYSVCDPVYDAATGGLSDLTIYQHIYPNEPRLWHRKTAEFSEPDRFRRLTHPVYHTIDGVQTALEVFPAEHPDHLLLRAYYAVDPEFAIRRWYSPPECP